MEPLPSGLPNIIGDDEDLARFLTQSSHFNALMAKPVAFLPSLKDRETSVSRHGEDSIEKLWEIGIKAANERKLYGAALFKASAVTEAQLQVAPDEPPARHAAIRGWPWLDNDPELQRAQQKERAVVLARWAKLLLRPDLDKPTVYRI